MNLNNTEFNTLRLLIDEYGAACKHYGMGVASPAVDHAEMKRRIDRVLRAAIRLESEFDLRVGV